MINALTTANVNLAHRFKFTTAFFITKPKNFKFYLPFEALA